ncbi:MAG: class I SAM-dependent methyltransferase [Oscillospiraceae bacterium]|nr:class I SAM-dependent methyltransferase [Oscillospiraceae bacterium]
MRKSKSDERIRALADLITGDIIADIGSDHAYLPIWLYLNKKIKKAYAADISPNCVNRIRENLKKYNISEEEIIPVLSDGFGFFDGKSEEFGEITDIVIAGMGGETIAEILASYPCVKGGVNFILQPNRKADKLREFLLEENFEIIGDIITESKKRRYNIINARLKF